MICVAELTAKKLAAVPPNVTLVVPRKLVPVMITFCPPPVEPDDG